MKHIIVIILFFQSILLLRAQDQPSFHFRSRALFDVALSDYGTDELQDYYRLEDFQCGFHATYRNYELVTDIGLHPNKVVVNDLIFNYHKNRNIFSLSNAYIPFSIEMLMNTSEMRFHQPAASSMVFSDGRKVGLTYFYDAPHFYFGGGAYSNNDINKIGTAEKDNSFLLASRAVWRKRNADAQTLLQLGGALSFRTKQFNTKQPVTFMRSVGVTSMFPAPLLEAKIDNMKNQMNGLLEFVCTSPRFMFQTEHFFSRTRRVGSGEAYCPYGGYVQGGFLLSGTGFKYDSMYATPGRPVSEKAIELVARFNYTNLNDDGAAIFGGEEKDLSVGMNVYLNKYLGVKIAGSYVWVGDNCNDFYKDNLFFMQTRFQYIF